MCKINDCQYQQETVIIQIQNFAEVISFENVKKGTGKPKME